MAFSVEADLNLSAERIIELTDSSAAPGVKDSVLLAALQLRATTKVEAAIYGKYLIDSTIPGFPPILTQLEADLWRFYLYEHREVMEIPATVSKAYTAACALLERYRLGHEALPAARVVGASDPPPSSGMLLDDSDDRVFGRAKDFI